MSTQISTALCLSKNEINALMQGRSIAATPQRYIYPRQKFGLCAIESQSVPETVLVKAWAECCFCQPLSESEDFAVLSRLIAKSVEELQQILQENQYIFLTHLKVYLLSQPIEVSAKFQGRSAALLNPVTVNTSLPVLSEQSFVQRQKQLQNLEPSLHPELEDLQSAIAHLSATFPAAKALEADIGDFLGCTSEHVQKPLIDSDLSWIRTIAQAGNSSDGYVFEKLVRKSLIKLGFSNSRNDPKASLDPDATGGAGGIDFYCDAPYSVVGECKATKGSTIPSGTPGQLLQLGKNHLQSDYDPCIKLIVSAGNLTLLAELTAKTHHMNVIRPETLQRLAALKVKYPGSIDLFDLKKRCLEVSPFGEESDAKLNSYIDEIEREVRIRFHLTQTIKRLSEIERDRTQFDVTEIRLQYNNSFSQLDGTTLKNEKVYELLMELASPLTGYLGRIKATSLDSDRFYYLRDLKLEL